MESLTTLVEALDVYLINKDLNLLIEKLELIKFNTENLTFTQIFLAGCSQIGISVSQLEGDLCKQGIYKVFGKYLSNDNGYICFKLKEGYDMATIRLSTGLDRNTVQFVSSVDEEEINLIVTNIVSDIKQYDYDFEKIRNTSVEIEAYLSNKSVKSIRPEYLVDKFKLSEESTISILERYVDKGALIRKFEAICPNDNNILIEENDYKEIIDKSELKCDICGSLYTELKKEDILQIIYEVNEAYRNSITIMGRKINEQNTFDILLEEMNKNDGIIKEGKNEEKNKVSVFRRMRDLVSLL